MFVERFAVFFKGVNIRPVSSSLFFMQHPGACLFCTFLRQATIRERTQAVEKLSISEAETGRLHVELAAACAAAENSKARVYGGDSCTEFLDSR